MELIAKFMATVIPILFYKFGAWYHSFGGMIPLFDKYIATVFPELSYAAGSWYHSFGAMI